MSKILARTITVMVLFLLQPVYALAETNNQDIKVAESVSVSLLQQDLQATKTEYLKQMMDSPEKRLEYVKSLYANQGLERAMVEQGLNQTQPLLESLRNARQRILLDTLVEHEFQKMNPDLEALAKERYMANPDQYQVRKKVKIAIISIQKKEGQEEQAKSKITEILAQLKKEPGNDLLFHDLAKQYSDDKKADQGGISKQWLVAPYKLKESPLLVQWAFSLEIPGQYSPIVETEQGFSIIKLMKVTPASQVDFKDAQEGIIKGIKSELIQSKKAEVVESLQAREDLTINDDMVKKMIAEAYNSRKADSETGG